MPAALDSCAPPDVTDARALQAFEIRLQAATEEARIPIPAHPTNGDEERYGDRCGTYTKCLCQAGPGVVSPTAYAAFRDALGAKNGNKPGSARFDTVPLGGERKLNGPRAAFAFTLIGTDPQQLGEPIVPAAPPLASPEYATELIELYWASLLRDVPFTEYANNKIALAAADELTALPYAGPRDERDRVTPRLLFRGGGKFKRDGGAENEFFAGERIGPYVSQFFIQPTDLGTQHIDQKMRKYAPYIDYMIDRATWEAVQSGIDTGFQLQPVSDKQHIHDGRGLAAFTHDDELYQAYLVAYLLMHTMQIPSNPGIPYTSATHDRPFGTFGGPDITGTLAGVARAALNAVWYQKWIVHLRHRPESGGGIVEMLKTGWGGVEGKLHDTVLCSRAVEASRKKYGSYFLSQAFPEGSPAHPAYPTGHGTVAGACITALKFFFDGKAIIPDPKVPARDGLSLEPYTSKKDDDSPMTVNGELHKLAHNVSFGHGIHAGIHWRSDTDYSILLGEAVALSYLRDLAPTYSEKFAVSLTKVDGTEAMISNE